MAKSLPALNLCALRRQLCPGCDLIYWCPAAPPAGTILPASRRRSPRRTLFTITRPGHPFRLCSFFTPPASSKRLMSDRLPELRQPVAAVVLLAACRGTSRLSKMPGAVSKRQSWVAIVATFTRTWVLHGLFPRSGDRGRIRLPAVTCQRLCAAPWGTKPTQSNQRSDQCRPCRHAEEYGPECRASLFDSCGHKFDLDVGWDRREL